MLHEPTARASLEVALSDGKSTVVGARSGGPLRLLTPRSHGTAAWVYQSSYGGGFVGSDSVALEVDVEPGSTLFLSSQASSKVYRASTSRFELQARVGRDATLVLWPDPVCCFGGAALTQLQHVAMDASSSLVLVDAWTAGRVAREERWAFERVHARLTIDIDGVRRFHDAFELSRAQGALPQRLAKVDAFATVVLGGPRTRPAIEALQARIAHRSLREETLVVASAWPWGLVLRLASPRIEGLGNTLRELLRNEVAALLGDDPLARKW